MGRHQSHGYRRYVMAEGARAMRRIWKNYRGKTKIHEKVAQGHRHKESGSYTETLTKEMKRHHNETVDHSGIESEVISLRLDHKQPKRIERGTTFRYTELTSAILASNQGEQFAGVIANAATTQQCFVTDGTGGGSTVAATAGGIALEALNPYTGTTGSPVLPATLIPLNNKFFINYLTMEIEFTNFTSASAGVDLFFVTPREWSRTDPVTDFNDCMSQEAGGILAGTVAVDSSNPPTMKIGSLRSIYPGVKPTQFAEWRKKWRVLGVRHFDLSGAANYRLTAKISMNLTVSRDKAASMNQVPVDTTLTDAELPVNYMREGTVVAFAIIRGSVVDVGPAAGANFASYAIGRVGFVINKKYTMQPMLGQASRLNIAEGGINIIQQAPLAQQIEIDENDAVATVKQLLV